MDRLKCRAVSRAWRHKFDFKLDSLCYSKHPSDFIVGKSRWISGPFVQNFASSTRFDTFFNAFGPTVLCNLKHLRLCDLVLNAENRTAFAATIQSFGQLEQLDIIRLCPPADFHEMMSFELTLPMLKSIRLEELTEIKELTVYAPNLQEIRVVDCDVSLSLNLVDVEPVESLIVSHLEHLDEEQVKNMKNLKCLHTGYLYPPFLSDLKQLKELHLKFSHNTHALFNEKRIHGLADLKIYLCGLLLDGPDDLRLAHDMDRGYPGKQPYSLGEQTFAILAKNLSRLAGENLLYKCLPYTASEPVDPALEIDALSRLTDLDTIYIKRPVQDIERFLNFVKNFNNLTSLRFLCDQPQELFDRLPEHCAVQRLAIILEPSERAPSDFEFLRRLKQLIQLEVSCLIDAELVRNLFEELPFLSQFMFQFKLESIQDITIQMVPGRPKRFNLFCGGWEGVDFPDINSVIQQLNANRKRKREEDDD